MITACVLFAATAYAGPSTDTSEVLPLASHDAELADMMAPAKPPPAKPPPKDVKPPPEKPAKDNKVNKNPKANLKKGPHWDDWTEIQPTVNVNTLLQQGGGTTLQTVVGLDGVAGFRYSESPNWFSETRIGGDFLLGVNNGSVGYDFSGSSVIGPDSDILRFTWGPELWFNGYGTVTSTRGYYLPASLGLSLPTALTVKAGDANLTLGGSPGWAFMPLRQNAAIAVVDELVLSALLGVKAGDIDLGAGYARTLNVAGAFNGIIAAVSAGI